MCQHLEMVKRDRDYGCSRLWQVVLQNLKAELQSALAPCSRPPYLVVFVDDSMVHEDRCHGVLPPKLIPNPYSNRHYLYKLIDKFAERNLENRPTSLGRQPKGHGANANV